MSAIKTTVSDASVADFIDGVEDQTKRQDSYTLLAMFEKVTGHKAKMWGTSIIGFGMYHYKSERSSQEGDWPLTAFSPRKQNLTLYIMMGTGDYSRLLTGLGKHKTGKACLYIAKLSDVDLDVLEQLLQVSYRDMMAAHGAK